MTRIALGSTIAFLFALTMYAQGPPPGQPVPPGPPMQPGQPTPSRTPPRAGRPGEDPQRGTAIMRGSVVAADSGAPLRRALVRAMSQDGRSGGTATTDADGRFEIKELLAGRYTVTATKAGYVSMSFGQRRPEQPGTILDVLDKQVVEKIALVLPRGGVVTGRVTDEFGEPVAGAQVQAMRYRYFQGARRLTPSGGAGTDDLGAFRIFGLAPGEYVISGAMRVNVSMGMSMQAGMAEVEGFAPTYFPGTPNPSEAQRVNVKTGQETAGVVFALTATRLSRISGRAVSSTGEPVGQAMVMVQAADRSSPTALMMSMIGGQTRADGTFQVQGVAAGTYSLTIRPRNPMDGSAEFGVARVTVAGEDVSNVLITMSRGGIARGVIITDDGTPLPVPASQINLYPRPVDPGMSPPIGGGPPRINDDGSFELSGLYERSAFTASLADNPDWALKAVRQSGVDVTDTGLDFAPGEVVDGIEVVLTRKRTDLSGTITDDRSAPALDATVVIFPQDTSKVTFASRFIRTARPDQEGRYQLRGMPPSDYFIIALSEIEPGRWQDPEYLDTLRQFATRLSLNEGETEVQNLRLVKAPQ